MERRKFLHTCTNPSRLQAWSDNSSEWKSISEDVKADMGLTFAHDGEFWMSFDDFMRNFEKIDFGSPRLSTASSFKLPNPMTLPGQKIHW